MTTTGLVFSSLAGVAGASALLRYFRQQDGGDGGQEAGLDPSTFRLYIAPLIFGLAPVINTAVSLLWHPAKGDPFHFILTCRAGNCGSAFSSSALARLSSSSRKRKPRRTRLRVKTPPTIAVSPSPQTTPETAP